MASTAAPGYFEEVRIGPYVHQVRTCCTDSSSRLLNTVILCESVKLCTMVLKVCFLPVHFWLTQVMNMLSHFTTDLTVLAGEIVLN